MTRPRASGFDEVHADDLVWLDREQMVEVDRRMVEELHIDLIQMMENAGRNLAQLAVRLFEPNSVAVLAGTGGNGGGGLVAARHLHNYGVDVSVILSRPASAFDGVPGHQLDIIRQMGLPILDDLPTSDVVIDAMVGYSLRGAPRGNVAERIRQVNGSRARVLALDVPSGLDVSDGSTPGSVVRADVTMTLALPKVGLFGRQEVGELYLADISVPPSVYRAMELTLSVLFSKQAIVRINVDDSDPV